MIGKHVHTCRLVAVAVSMMSLPITSSAAAMQHHPKGIFAPFADCPSSNPSVALCMIARIPGGEFVLGKRTVPIGKTITLQGGLVPAGGANLNEYVLTGAEDGNTLSKTPLSVPGGLSGIGRATGVSEVVAIAELAKPLSGTKVDIASFAEETGVALRLPLQIKLENRLLGAICSIGSSQSPVVLELTDGTTSPPAPTKPITGSFGESRSIFEAGREITRVSNVRLVDNAFAAPVATGCGQPYAALVDLNLGLPSSAGRNTAILDSTLEVAEVAEVKASE